MADVIQEFLVAIGIKLDPSGLASAQTALKGLKTAAGPITVGLGFKVDASTLNTAQNAIKGITGGLINLRGGIVATGVAFTVGMAKMAREFDQLYFMSERTGVVADRLNAIAYASAQVSGNAEAATTTLQTLASQARSLPPGVIEGLVRLTTGSEGPLKNADQQRRAIMERWSRNLKEMGKEAGHFQNTIEAGIIGVNYELELINVLHWPETIKKEQEAAQTARIWHVNLKDVSKQAHDLDNAFGRVAQTLTIINTKFLSPALTDLLNRIASTLDRLGRIWRYIPDWLKPPSGEDPLRMGHAISGARIGPHPDRTRHGDPFKLSSPAGIKWEDKTAREKEDEEASEGGTFQRGGIVRINAHAGEMVLPEPISRGLIAMISAGNRVGTEWKSADTSAVGSEGKAAFEGLHDWLQGSTSMIPTVRLADGLGLGTGEEGEGGAGEPGGGGGAPRHGDPFGRHPRVGGGASGTGDSAWLEEAARRESGNKNITQKGGGPASGYFQIEDATWKDFAPGLGISTPRAMDASRDDQMKVAMAILHKQGPGAWKAMRGMPGPSAMGGVPGSVPPGGGGPAGAAAAVDAALQMQGMHEQRDRGVITSFLKAGGVNLDPATAAWCAAFVNSNLEQHGIGGSGSSVATSFAKWGQPVVPSKITKGDVVVEMRGHRPGESGGHVGEATGNVKYGPGGEVSAVETIAGNVHDQVTKSWVKLNDQVLARRAAEASVPDSNTFGPQASVTNNSGHTLHVDNRTEINFAGGDGGQHLGALDGMLQRQNGDMIRNLSGAIV